MTDEQINQRIADACGWDEDCVLNTDGDRIWVTKFPLYCTDLNAMHEAEKVLAPKNWNNFAENWWNYCKLLRGHDADEAIHATARHRAEAFLKTLGKWEEVQG